MSDRELVRSGISEHAFVYFRGELQAALGYEQLGGLMSLDVLLDMVSARGSDKHMAYVLIDTLMQQLSACLEELRNESALADDIEMKLLGLRIRHLNLQRDLRTALETIAQLNEEIERLRDQGHEQQP